MIYKKQKHMKNLIVFMATVVLFIVAQNTFGQYSVNNLQKNCTIYPDAQFILRNASSNMHTQIIEMSEYSESVDGRTLSVEMATLYEWGHANIVLNKVANDIWSLVSKQLHGETGLLSLSKMNFIPTNNEKGQAVLAIFMWDKTKNKWAIMSVPLYRIKVLYKGARMFTPKN